MATESSKAKPPSSTRLPGDEDAASRRFWRVVNALGIVAPYVLGVAFLFALLRFTGQPVPTGGVPAASPARGPTAAAEPTATPGPPADAAARVPNPVQPVGAAPEEPSAPAAGLDQASTAPAPAGSEPVTVTPELAQAMQLSGDSPEYPAIAKAAHVQGTVVLEVTVDKSGAVQDLRALSGAPILQSAAITAVRTWRYKPYVVQGSPARFRTHLKITFQITPGSSPAQ